MEHALKPKQVADLLSIHVDRYYALANAGEIPAFRLGREWRTDPRQLELFMRGEWAPKPKRTRGRQLKSYDYLRELNERGPSLH